MLQYRQLERGVIHSLSLAPSAASIATPLSVAFSTLTPKHLLCSSGEATYAGSPFLAGRRPLVVTTATFAPSYSHDGRRFMSVSPKKKARRAAARAHTEEKSIAEHFTVALVGRPNVGKSSLFNRLVGRRLAIVNKVPGTTRDWKEEEGRIGDLRFTVMDTGGLEDSGGSAFLGPSAAATTATAAGGQVGSSATAVSVEAKMLSHTAAAIAKADLVLFIVDAESGVGPQEIKFSRWLKKLRLSAPSSSNGGSHSSSGDGDDDGGLGVRLVINKADKLGAFSFVAGEDQGNNEDEGDGVIGSEGTDDGADWTSTATAAASSPSAAKVREHQGRWELLRDECYSLGLGDPIAISAENRGLGFSDLHNALLEAAIKKGKARQQQGRLLAASEEQGEEGGEEGEQAAAEDQGEDDHEADNDNEDDEATAHEVELAEESPEEKKQPIQLAIVGRPNVGKSSLVNAILGHERVLTGPQAGLTRDPTTVVFEREIPEEELSLQQQQLEQQPVGEGLEGHQQHHRGRAKRTLRFQMVDTAGMRRWGSWDLTTPLEGEAVGAAKRALQRSNVVVLVVDASGGTKDGLLQLGGATSQELLQQGSGAVKGTLSTKGPSSSSSSSSSAPVSDTAVISSQAIRSSRDTAGAGLTRQDMAIAEQVLEEGRSLVVALNKVDTLAPQFARNLMAILANRRAAWSRQRQIAAAAGEAPAAESSSSSASSSSPVDADAEALMQMLELEEQEERDGGAPPQAAAAAADEESATSEQQRRRRGRGREQRKLQHEEKEKTEKLAPLSPEEQAKAERRLLSKLLKHPNVKRVIDFVRSQLDSMHQCQGTEIVPLSTVTGAGKEDLLPAIARTHQRWNARIPTSTLNKWLELVQRHHPPPSDTVTIGSARPDKNTGHKPTRKIPLKLKFLSQTATRPPTFTLRVNRNAVPESYSRYLMNALRREFDLFGVPVRMKIKAAENPYKTKNRNRKASSSSSSSSSFSASSSSPSSSSSAKRRSGNDKKGKPSFRQGKSAAVAARGKRSASPARR